MDLSREWKTSQLRTLRNTSRTTDVQFILDQNPKWKPVNHRLDGVERVNEHTVAKGSKLLKRSSGIVDPKHRWQKAIQQVNKLFKTHAPVFYSAHKRQFAFNDSRYNLLKTHSKDYEMQEFIDDDDDADA
eukprot:640281_1